MLLLDTNVLVRLMLQDDPVQGARVDHLLSAAVQRGEVLAVPDVIVMELFWVLTGMGFPRPDILKSFIKMMDNAVFQFEDHERTAMAVGLWADYKVDFADAYLAARFNTDGANGVVSFDQDFKRLPVHWIQP